MRKDDEFADIRSQMQFCAELVQRLNDEIQEEDRESPYYGGMRNHYQKQQDIKRIRRELLRVYKMLNPWRKEGEKW